MELQMVTHTHTHAHTHTHTHTLTFSLIVLRTEFWILDFSELLACDWGQTLIGRKVWTNQKKGK